MSSRARAAKGAGPQSSHDDEHLSLAFTDEHTDSDDEHAALLSAPPGPAHVYKCKVSIDALHVRGVTPTKDARVLLALSVGSDGKGEKWESRPKRMAAAVAWDKNDDTFTLGGDSDILTADALRADLIRVGGGSLSSTSR
jgi:hypothetical protein